MYYNNTILLLFFQGKISEHYYFILKTDIGPAFTIDANNTFVRGPLGYSSHIVSVLLLLNLLFLTFKKYKGRARFFVVPLICTELLLGSMILDVSIPEAELFTLSFVVLAIVICWLRRNLSRASLFRRIRTHG